jgi:hypothetical protein
MQATRSLHTSSRGAQRAPSRLLGCLILAIGALGLFYSSQALAQANFAQIQGTVTAEETGKSLGSVTVVVNGPALQEFQSEVTDNSGRYLITQLPPGDDYVVSFYFGSDDKPRVQRPGIRLSLGKTITVNASIKLTAGKRDVKIIQEAAPNVDTASTSTGVEVNKEVVKNTAVRGRTFESLITLAPGTADVAGKTGAAGGDVGVQISGSTGNENNYIIDGLNTSDPSHGLIGTQLSQYFIKEVNIITGGYQAEYGRATGGIINLATNSGSNEFHGSVFGSYQPPSLDPRGVARLGEALITRNRVDAGQTYDFGFEVGGPIWKDRIWFYAGFAPTFTDHIYRLTVRTQQFDATSPSAQHAAIDPNFECPSYLASNRLCDGPRQLALLTNEIDGSTRNLSGNQRLYNGIAKLQFNFNPDHNITLTYIGSPTTFDDYAAVRGVDLESQRYTQVDQVHDAIFHYIGKVADRKLQFDVLYGYHYQQSTVTPNDSSTSLINWLRSATNPFTLADFENIPDCARQTQPLPTAANPNNTYSFNPCPITSYTRGYGGYNISTLQRHQLIASGTYFLHLTGKHNPLGGIHQLKVGFEFEQLSDQNFRTFTGSDLAGQDDGVGGHRSYGTLTDGSVQISREYATQGGLDANGKPIPDTHLNGFTGESSSRNYSVYLRDSWNVGWAPGLILNLGVRWEGQELYASDGSRQIDIKDNWAPRVGIVYDFTQLTSRPGRGKVFFNYGRFYQSIPLNLNDRQFTAEGLYSSGFSASCPTAPLQPGGAALPMPGQSCNFLGQDGGLTSGGRYPLVAPGLKGQYINEIVAGFNYDIGLDIVVGASYIHRELGNIIEDLSPDGGATYVIGNPGVPTDPALVQQLKDDVTRLQGLASAPGLTPAQKDSAQKDLADAQGRLSAYPLVGSVFPRAVRNYDALVLTLNKRLSNRFSIISSYTYSRNLGNYPGTFSSNNGQNDPNISSQFDLTNLLANRNGPLPADRPHNFKVSAFYVQPVAGDRGSFTVGLTFSAVSGRPIEVLGRHPTAGRREVFLLPRGSGGRTPFITQFDLHIGYEHKLTKRVSLSVFADAVNLFNQQAVTNVDDEYTTSTVASVPSGRLSDLGHLKDNGGNLISYNSNYGQPTAYQLPLYFRLGGRLSF